MSILRLLDNQHSYKFYLFGDYHLPDANWLPHDTDNPAALYCYGNSLSIEHVRHFMELLNSFQYNNLINYKERISD